MSDNVCHICHSPAELFSVGDKVRRISQAGVTSFIILVRAPLQAFIFFPSATVYVYKTVLNNLNMLFCGLYIC